MHARLNVFVERMRNLNVVHRHQMTLRGRNISCSSKWRVRTALTVVACSLFRAERGCYPILSVKHVINNEVQRRKPGVDSFVGNGYEVVQEAES